MNRVILAGACSLALASSAAAQGTPSARPPLRPSVYAITNATLVPVVGPKVPNGTLVIRDGKIVAAGAGIAVPAGATVIDASGLFVYPGMIDSGTRLGLVEIGSVPGGQDTQELGQFNPQDDVLTAVNPHSTHIGITRANGITSVITSAEGGLIQGTAALIDLDGWTPEQMAESGRVAMVMTYPRVGGGGRFRGGRGGPNAGDPAETQNRQVKELMDYLRTAKAYNERPNPEHQNLAYAALGPALRGEVPVIFDVQTEGQIRGALALADSFKLKPILRGATEAWMLADTLAARKVPVIVGPMVQTPDGDAPYDAIYAMPGVLAKAGVQIAFQTNDAGEGDARNLPYNAALAEAYGLDPDEALKAVTINPARIWGLGDKLGSLEVGKVANLFVTTGDPLDVRSLVKHVFIRGQLMPWDDRHTLLYEKFRARPKP
ncbi:MAG TPA: amidohydrolase family protein [Gemmatimonadales bacterium]|nr:amidohydrolase family protein [Gemmatimonadales bacterium]